MQVMKAYLKGISPMVVSEFLTNFDMYNLKFGFKISLWNFYLILSYLLLFPLVIILRQKNDARKGFDERLSDSLKKSNKNPMRLGSQYANTKMFGVSRLGDSNSNDGILSKIGVTFVYYLLVLIFSPFFLFIYILFKK